MDKFVLLVSLISYSQLIDFFGSTLGHVLMKFGIALVQT